MRRRKIPRFTRRRPDRRRGCRRGRAERMNEQNGGVGKTPADNPFAALDAGRPAWDALGAFVPAPQPRIAGKASGPLAGLTFAAKDIRSEEHTSELQSLMRISYAVFCFKKNTQ